jgi:multimeric flavodoxin WrbA/putative sterol carrier protein
MKILLVRGNARKNGYTRYCTDLLAQGLHEGQAEVIDRDLCGCNIQHCRGCYSCWTTSPGACILRDYMQSLLSDFLAADLVICATPLNAYSCSSVMKAFLDRFLPLTQPGFEVMPNGLPRNALRFPEKWPKKLFALIVGAFKGEENFDAVRKMFSLFADGMHLDYCGDIIRPESYLLQFTLAKPLTIKTIETAFVKAGYELATEGRVSDATRANASLPLSSDMAHFSKYSNIYWEHAVALANDSLDLKELQKKVTSDVRILMQEMARTFDPAATARVKAVLQFDFPDKEYHFRVAIDKGSCVLSEKESDRPDLRVTVNTDVWAGVFMRTISARDALTDHRITLEGDKSLFSKLDRYFPPPVT